MISAKAKKKAANGVEAAGSAIEPVVKVGAVVSATVESVTKVAVPFANFLPLIGEVASICNEIVDVYQAAEHNKRICGIMLDRVQVAETAVKNLKNRRDQNIDFFNENNYVHLQKLIVLIRKIRKFAEDISQLKGLSKYVQAKSIEKKAKELISEFDSTIQIMQFALMIDFNARADKDNKDIKADVEDLTQYLKDIGGGITDINQNVSEVIEQLSALNTSVNQIMEQQKNTGGKPNDVFQSESLPYSDFEDEGAPASQKVKKYRRRKSGLNDLVALKLVADKSSDDENLNKLKNQVSILKKLEKCRCIIQFYGLTTHDDKWYLVTEWADLGNLREYYTKHAFEVKLKLRFARDIARGLNFLSATGIVHRDIRAENILITDHETAKISNFKASRAISDSTTNQSATPECVRYCAPEKLVSRSQRSKYDTKSEVFSFGILLWEMAEEKIPYEKCGDDIIAITELVCTQKYREPFSFASPLPKEYQEIAHKAVEHDPNFRPPFSKIFTILQELCERDGRPPPSPRLQHATLRRSETFDSLKLSKDEEAEFMILPNFEDFNYMTVDEAAKQHKRDDGNRELAYKCFEAYAELGDMKAKYFKAYYIQQGYAKVNGSKDKEVEIAELYKEVADSGDEFPEAQLRYGNCLFRGQGVKRNLKDATEYFRKAAENGQVVGMFNAASLFFSGGAGKKDPVLGERYMKLAAYKQHSQAIEYCKKNNIPL